MKEMRIAGIGAEFEKPMGDNESLATVASLTVGGLVIPPTGKTMRGARRHQTNHDATGYGPTRFATPPW